MFVFRISGLLAFVVMLVFVRPAAAESISCRCEVAFVCDGKACLQFDTGTPTCFTFKLTFDRKAKKIRLCRDAMCEEGKMSVEKMEAGQMVLRTSLTWGGGSGGQGTWIMVDQNADFTYRQKDGAGVELITGPCE
ncbi:MAG: hypothetical protein R3D57_06200 [Hyphomicrobiaceae bacterium]